MPVNNAQSSNARPAPGRSNMNKPMPDPVNNRNRIGSRGNGQNSLNRQMNNGPTGP